MSALIATAAICLATTVSGAAPPATEPAVLRPADAKMLDQLFADGLFDPTGHRFITFTVTTRDVWGGSQNRTVSGWLADPKDNRNIGDVAWAVLISGEAVPVAGTTKPADFSQTCQKLMDDAAVLAAEAKKARAAKPTTQPNGKPADGIDVDKTFKEMEERPWRFPPTEPLEFIAAWLHRLGNDALAAQMLAMANTDPLAEEKNDHPAAVPLRMDAWHWYSGAVHAYMVGADAEALFYVRAMASFQPDAMKPAVGEGSRERGQHFPHAAKLLSELERRRTEGTFNQPSAKLPADFAAWPVDRRVQWLIRQLQDVDARQGGQPGGVDLADDKRVAALIEIGDPAVPALIDCIGSDQRLTRSVHFWRDFSDDRTVMGVREAALTAVMSILQTRIFEPASTGDTFTSRGEEAAKDTARTLKQYWKTYGSLPLDARMMKILTDEKAKPEAWREAAENLAHFGQERTLGTTVWTGRIGNRKPTTQNSVAGRFKNPTAAEAILAAMDRQLAAPKAKDSDRPDDDALYIGSVIDLHDTSIVPALLKRLEKSPPLRMRTLLANACHELGDSGPVIALARDVRTGRISPPQGKPFNSELGELIGVLAHASEKVPAANEALFSITDPKHLLHDIVAANVRSNADSYDHRVWREHPFSLCFLRQDLDDEQLSGVTISITREGSNLGLSSKSANSSGWSSLPRQLMDPAVRRDHIKTRSCDETAEKVAETILGIPYYHPLLNDADRRLKDLKTFLDAHVHQLRRATRAEMDILDSNAFHVSFILNVRPLPVGATAEDVADGRAIFHLDGNWTPLQMKLPATASLKRDLPPPGKEPTQADVDAGRAGVVWTTAPDAEDGKEPQMQSRIEWQIPRVLILQAERGPDGKLWYGIISRYDMRKIAGEELGDIKPLEGK